MAADESEIIAGVVDTRETLVKPTSRRVDLKTDLSIKSTHVSLCRYPSQTIDRESTALPNVNGNVCFLSRKCSPDDPPDYIVTQQKSGEKYPLRALRCASEDLGKASSS